MKKRQIMNYKLRTMLAMGIMLLTILSSPVQAQNNICTGVTGTSPVECEALVTLYENSSSSGWSDRTNWLLTATPCEWYGVTCRDGHVTMLSLSNNDLTGSLPADIGQLTELEILDLSGNNLSGHLPAEIGNMRQLRWLYLNDNPLSGAIPLNLMDLDNLEILWLYNTNMCEPTDRSFNGWLTRMEDFQRSNVTCSTIATTASVNIAPETEFNCDDVTEIPKMECETLVMLYNETGGSSWGKNTNWLQNNTPCNWHGVTCEAGHVTQLALANNGLTGKLPAELSNLTNLTSLDLSNNSLEGPIPGALVKLPLTNVNLENTKLCKPQNGIFDTWFSEIKELTGEISDCDVPATTADMLTTVTESDTVTATTTETETITATATTTETETITATAITTETEPITTTATTTETETITTTAITETAKLSDVATDDDVVSALSPITTDDAAALSPPASQIPQSGGVLSSHRNWTIVLVGLMVMMLLTAGITGHKLS
jgi:hypothetical protein